MAQNKQTIDDSDIEVGSQIQVWDQSNL